MKNKIICIFIVLIFNSITAKSETSYKIYDKEFNFKKYPKVEFKLWTRALAEIDSNKIYLKEEDKNIANVSYQLISNTDRKGSVNKTLFILIENHYLSKGINERIFFKQVLFKGLNGKIKKGDKVFIGTFDWYRDNRYMILQNKEPADDLSEIFSIIQNISAPSKLTNKQIGSDIYFALDETLAFLTNNKDSLPKNILLLSDDYPNIVSQKTVEEIRTESLKSDIPIYAIGYNIGADRYSQITKDEISLPTNGGYFLSRKNDVDACADKVGEFVDNMNKNSLGKTYMVAYTSSLKKTGQKVTISIGSNDRKIEEVKVSYPFNLFHWLKANVILSIIILLGFILLGIVIYLVIKRIKLKKIQHIIEEQEKQMQIRNAESEIERLKQQQQSSERRLYDQKNQIEEEGRLEKLKHLMKAKALIPRVTYDYKGQKGQFYIDSPKFTLGRDQKSNSFHMNVPSVSKNHAEIMLNENGQFTIKDLNSTNGVIINGNKVDIAVLKNADTILLGDVILKINL